MTRRKDFTVEVWQNGNMVASAASSDTRSMPCSKVMMCGARETIENGSPASPIISSEIDMTILRQRQPRVTDAGYLAFVRTKPCCFCGHGPPSEAAHIRMSSAKHGALNPGVGAKPDDSKCTPLCTHCHARQHAVGERAWWERIGIDPFAVAAALHAEYQTTKRK